MSRRNHPPEPTEDEYCQDCEQVVVKGEPASHDEDCPRYREPPDHCSLCRPRPDEHRRSDVVTCAEHTVADVRERERALIEQYEDDIEEAMDERYNHG